MACLDLAATVSTHTERHGLNEESAVCLPYSVADTLLSEARSARVLQLWSPLSPPLSSQLPARPFPSLKRSTALVGLSNSNAKCPMPCDRWLHSIHIQHHICNPHICSAPESVASFQQPLHVFHWSIYINNIHVLCQSSRSKNQSQ